MTPPAETVQVRMLGPLEVRVGPSRLGPRDFGGIKPKQLLELLLLARGRTVAKDRIAELLWGDAPPQRTAATIEAYVSVLRRTLGGGRHVIATDARGYRAAADGLDVDLDRFEALLREAAAGPGRRAALEAAVALGEPELLADEPYADWVLPARAHYRERQVQALVDLAECCLEAGDPGAALRAAERAAALEPTRERAYRAAMRAQRAAGDRDAALRTYERCRAALDAELGVAPSAETARLHLALLRDELPRRRGPRPVAYARHGPTRIAFQVVGDGPVDLVFSPSNVSHLAASWDDPTYAAFLHALAGMSRLILFDKRGTGLSDPALDFPTTRERSEDLVAVLDAAGAERAVLFGVCGGGALCAQLAADHPDRAAGLILHNAMARMLVDDDYPWGWTRERYARLLDGFEAAWMGSGEGLVRRNPGLAGNPRYREWFAHYVRLGASPWMARRLTEMNAELDVRGVLGRIRAPTLVICRTEDAWLSPENSRYLAREIRGAQLVELPGTDHDPWVGDQQEVLAVIARFLAAPAQPGLRAVKQNWVTAK